MANANHLTIDRELRYIVQWFTEWSELQRDDFLPILVECLINNSNNTATLNGIMSGMAIGGFNNDKPMSLFQCRVKLFREWSSKWPEDIRKSLQEKVQIIEPAYGERVRNALLGDHIISNSNGSAAAAVAVVASVNGFANIPDLDNGESNDLLLDEQQQPQQFLSPSIPVQNEPLLA